MTNMKRAISDSESDGEFDDKSGSGVGHGMDRKKRRGVIEKRRRDRINNSLSELRRLVPAAFEKQGSAKLEKAEILQMTVDHLKCLHAKGVNGYNLDTAALAIDYRSVGFRECVAEVARYMVTVEGMDIQDPLRLRLLSHLQCYSAQREAASKASLSNMNSAWSSHHHSSSAGSMGSSSHHGSVSAHQYNGSTQSMGSTMSMISQHAAAGSQGDHGMSAAAASGLYSSSATDHPASRHMSSSQPHDPSNMGGMRLPGTAASQMPTSASSTGQVTPSVLSGLSQMHSQFPVGFSMNSMPMLSPSGSHYSATSTSLGKPYRPWGAELAY